MSTTTHSSVALLDFRSKLRACQRCDLRNTATTPVPWSGDINPDILIIGEAPGETEDKLGEPFVGTSGQLLRTKLKESGLWKVATIAFANATNCYPARGLSPTKDVQYINECNGWLKGQVALIAPKYVVSVGQVAFRAIRGNLLWPDLQLLHGKPLFWATLRDLPYPSKPVPWWPTYHPSAALRSAKYKKLLSDDLIAFKKWVDEGERWPAEHCYVCGTEMEGWDAEGFGIPLCRKHLSRQGELL